MQVPRLAATSLLATLAYVAVLSAAAVAFAVAVFGLTLAGAIALYFVVWWTVLFAILPLGVRSQAETGEVIAGTDPGAPALPALNEKAIWTTVVSAIIFVVVVWLLPLAGF